jgi:hypothetical protein
MKLEGGTGGGGVGVERRATRGPAINQADSHQSSRGRKVAPGRVHSIGKQAAPQYTTAHLEMKSGRRFCMSR